MTVSASAGWWPAMVLDQGDDGPGSVARVGERRMGVVERKRAFLKRRISSGVARGSLDGPTKGRGAISTQMCSGPGRMTKGIRKPPHPTPPLLDIDFF